MSTGVSAGCSLGIDVAEPATLVLAVVPAASAGTADSSSIELSHTGGALVGAPTVVEGPHGAVEHVVVAPRGRLEIEVAVHLTRPPASVAPPAEEAATWPYLRPSRFCPSDRFVGLASAELGHLAGDRERVEAAVAWVARRLVYLEGSSGPLDSAVETLLAGQGVCRDYAHLLVTMCRALAIPARVASVYAPGLFPMDFHAVTEAYVEGAWNVFDPTYLAPRPDLVRIATGRDGADTAFLTVVRGRAELTSIEVRATTDGDLTDEPFGALVGLR
jgi:transglutaminase-like putative cysteine protease